MTNPQAITLFQQARAHFLQRRFQEARETIASYRAAVDYNQFTRQDQRTAKPVQTSVIVVTLEGGPGLEACVQSLAAQSDPEFEVIVVDNGGRPAPRQPWPKLPCSGLPRP